MIHRLLLLALASFPSSQDSAIPLAAIPLPQAARAFAEAEAAALSDGGKLWGRELLGPLLLVDPATHAAVANQADDEGLLKEHEGVFVGTLPPEVNVANTATEWAGVRWTMVLWPLPANRYARTRLLLHESFHRIQPELGHAGGDPLSLHLDTEAGRTWLRLEYRALGEALLRKSELRKRSIEDALLFRARRRALFPEALANESAFERNEGLAEYTGLCLSGYPVWVLADRAAQKLEQDETAASFVRSFAYATGPAYGVLLDEHGGELATSWRKAIDGKTDLGALLARALGWRVPEDLAAQAEKRAERYDGAAVAAAEAQRARQRAQQDQRNRARFVDGPVLHVPLGAGVNYSFDPNDITPLGELGSVYGTVRVVDAWGILEVSGGALLARDANGRMSAAIVPAPERAEGNPLVGNGWTLTLNEGWKLATGAREHDLTLTRAP